MTAILEVVAPLLAVLMMVAVGLALEPRHFRELLRRRLVIVGALAGQVLLLPLLGWLVIRTVALPPHLTAGLSPVAAFPIGDIANFYALLARANLALSVTLNTLSCVLSVVSMAFALFAYERWIGTPFQLAVPPATLVLRLVALIAMPIVMGMLVRWKTPRLADRLMVGCKVFCGTLIVLVLAMILIVRGPRLATDWLRAAAASTMLIVVAMLAGFFLGRVLRLSNSETATLAIIFPVRNLVLATTLAVTLLGRLEYAVFALVYFLVEVPLVLGAIGLHHYYQTRAAARVG